MLETENKKLARALAREVGDEIPLSKVLEEGTDWKGRREQIVHLKDTIRQLKESAGGAAAAPSSLIKHETQHRSVIGKLNKERNAEMERMQAEMEAAKKAAEQLRLQYAGASSRRKVLEEEVSASRATVKYPVFTFYAACTHGLRAASTHSCINPSETLVILPLRNHL